MRKSVAACSATLLAATLVGVVVVCVQLVLPAPAYARQIPAGFEDGGDPDMPDQVMCIEDTMDGLVTAPEVVAQDAGSLSDTRGALGLPLRGEPGLSRARTGRRESLLTLWFLMTSMVLAP